MKKKISPPTIVNLSASDILSLLRASINALSSTYNITFAVFLCMAVRSQWNSRARSCWYIYKQI